MHTSIWYRTEEKQPSKSGYYLTYRGWGMGGKADGESDHGYLFYHTKTANWYEDEYEDRSINPRTCIVYYWTDADPYGWTEQDPPSTALRKMKLDSNHTLESAWEDVQLAVNKYNLIKELIR